MPSAAAARAVQHAAKSASVMSAPSTLMRSFMRARWGEMYSPVRYPAALSTLLSRAQALPLPFVPATWTKRSESCGRPSRSRSSAILPSPGFEPSQDTPSIYLSASS